MELTPEERRRIYEEEKVRVEEEERIRAQARHDVLSQQYHRTAPPGRPNHGKRSSPFINILAGLITVGAIVGVLAMVGSGQNPADKQRVNQTSTYSDSPALGSPSSGPPAPTSADDMPPVSPLVKESENFTDEDGYCQISGEITSRSSDKLENLEAVTTFYDSGGNVVTTTDALVDYNPLLPGQTSPYKTMHPDNPAIDSERTTFQEMGGSEIDYVNKAPVKTEHSQHHKAKRVRTQSSSIRTLGNKSAKKSTEAIDDEPSKETNAKSVASTPPPPTSVVVPPQTLADREEPAMIGDWGNITIPGDFDQSTLTSTQIVIEFTVNVSGRPEHVRVKTSSGNSDLDNQCVSLIQSHQYKPAIHNGEAETMTTEHTFSLQ